MPKLTMTGPNGLNFEADPTDESQSAEWRGKLVEAVKANWLEFVDRCAAAARDLKPGETVTLHSTPIEFTITQEAD